MNTRNKKTEPDEAATGPAAQANGPVVYCGPTIKNLVRQYSVYSAGLPAALAAFVENNRAAKGLIVPLDRYAETRRALETPASAEAILYEKIKKGL